MKERSMQYGKHMLTVLMSMALMLTFAFMPALPGLGIGAVDVSAATPMSGTYTGQPNDRTPRPAASNLDWQIKSDGTLVLGKAGETQVLNMPLKSSTNTMLGAALYTRQVDWPWNSERANIKKIEFAGPVKASGSLAWMFCNMNIGKQPDFTNFDTTEVTSMKDMFKSAFTIENDVLDFNKLNVSNVTDMSGMISGFYITGIDISSWGGPATDPDGNHVTNVKNFAGTFADLPSTYEIKGLGDLVATPDNMENMFKSCVRLQEIDLSGFDTSNVKSMAGLFESCQDVEQLDISNFDTSAVEDMNRMFSTMTRCKDIKIGSNFNTSKVTNIESMFNNARILPTGVVQNIIDKMDMSNVENAKLMFVGCRGITSLDFAGKTTPKLLRATGMFRACENLKTITNFDLTTGGIRDAAEMFLDCRDLSQESIQSIMDKWDASGAYTMTSFFGGCYQLKTIDLSKFNPGYRLENVSNLFEGCRNLESITGLGKAMSSAPRIKDASRMFYQCFKLKSVDVSWIDAHRLATVSGMFAYCTSLEEVQGIKNWSIGNTVDLDCTELFYDCRKLKEIDLSAFADADTVRLGGTFYNCYNLKIDGFMDWAPNRISHWSTTYGVNNKTFTNCVTFGEIEKAKMGADNMDAYPADLKAQVEDAVESLDRAIAGENEATENYEMVGLVSEAEEAVKTQMPAMLTAAQTAAADSLKAAQAAQGTPQAQAAADKAVADAEKAGALAKANYSINVALYGAESQQAKDAQTVVTTTSKTVQDTKVIQKQATSPTKKANTLKIKAKTANVKVNNLKKKAQSLKVSKVITFTNKGQGALSYKKVSGNKKITINAKSGKVTVKKGLKKGTYKVKVNVTAAGNAGYNKATKAVTIKIKVK